MKLKGHYRVLGTPAVASQIVFKPSALASLA
jgi:hypothetical protein